MKGLKFRKAALNKSNSPALLTDLVKVVPFYDAIAIAFLVLFFTAVIIWGIWGSIPTRVSGQGILLSQHGVIYDIVAPQGEGFVIAIVVKPGDIVQKNQIVAHLDVPDLSKQIMTQKGYVDTLQKKFTDLTTFSQQDISKQLLKKQETVRNLQDSLQAMQKNHEILTDLIKRKQELQKRGITTKQDIADTFNIIYTLEVNIKETSNKIIQTDTEFTAFKQRWENELRALELTFLQAQKELSQLIEKNGLGRVVKSPIHGVITTIQVSIGDSVKGGTSVMSIADIQKGLDALIFIPPDQGQRVKKEDATLVSPTSIEKEEWGSLIGKVVSVSKYPSTQESLMALLHNKNLVEVLTKNQAPIAVRIHILSDKNTSSGYLWSSGKGPNQSILPGMLAKAEITTELQSPFSLFIPTLKRWLKAES